MITAINGFILSERGSAHTQTNYFFFFFLLKIKSCRQAHEEDCCSSESLLPSRLGNNHLRPEFMKLVPKILGFQCNFGVVVDFLLGLQALHAAEMSRLMVAEGRVEPSLCRPGQAVVRDRLGERPGRQAERREEGRLRGR